MRSWRCYRFPENISADLAVPIRWTDFERMGLSNRGPKHNLGKEDTELEGFPSG